MNDNVSDEATGLPPLEELGDDPVMAVLAWATCDGIVSSINPGGTAVACRYLHVRGVVGFGRDGQPEWAQVHLAVPVESAVDVAVGLAGGNFGGTGWTEEKDA